jgi:manganese transport protein
MLSLLPAWFIIMEYGEDTLGPLLVTSQIVLSMQLPFAMAPLIWFNGRRDMMGQWRLALRWRIMSWLIFSVIVSANLYLLYKLATS